MYNRVFGFNEFVWLWNLKNVIASLTDKYLVNFQWKVEFICNILCFWLVLEFNSDLILFNYLNYNLAEHFKYDFIQTVVVIRNVLRPQWNILMVINNNYDIYLNSNYRYIILNKYNSMVIFILLNYNIYRWIIL